MDPVAAFFSHPTPRRLLLVSLFVLILYEFAHLLPMLAAFAVFQRVLSMGGALVANRTGWRASRSAIAVALVIAAAVFGALWMGGRTVAGLITRIQADFPAVVTTVKSTPIAQRVLELAGDTDWADTGFEAASRAMEWLREVGFLALNVAVGFTMALIWALEQQYPLAHPHLPQALPSRDVGSWRLSCHTQRKPTSQELNTGLTSLRNLNAHSSVLKRFQRKTISSLEHFIGGGGD